MRIFLCLILFSSSLFAEKIRVDLRNPSYKEGVLRTEEGGIVTAKDLRIQALILEYTQRKENGEETQTLSASGNLMLQYKGRIFIGKKLEYDFLKQSGAVYEGKTCSNLWFIGGDRIDLKSDGSYVIENATLSASENKESAWDLFAQKACMSRSDLLQADNVAFRFAQTPALWLPSFKINLGKEEKDPILRYIFDWEREKGVKAGVRYRLYSWRDLALFGRVEYRWTAGWSGAIESEYFPPNSRSSFITRSYLGTDRLETAPDKEFRFRLEGAYRWQSPEGNTSTVLSWDKYSDVRMPSDFKSEDFEVGTAGQTLFWIQHKEPFALFHFKARPRVNAFESIKQDLPTFYLNTLPIELGKSGIISSFWLKASYLNFAYSNQLTATATLRPPADYRSGRFEIREKLQRSFSLGKAAFVPYLGAIGVFYTNSASGSMQPLGLLTYGADLTARIYKNYEKSKHILEPYARFSALTTPTASLEEHYIFSIADGFHSLQQLQTGIRSYLYAQDALHKKPWFTLDLYTRAFFSDPTIPQYIPWAYLQLEWNLPSVVFSLRNSWNIRNHVLDYCNARCGWTIHEDMALSLEARYRSQYHWRKADHENFLLDVARSQSELLSSPLSDRRLTLLANCFFRITPFWECHIQSHHGFLRALENPYNEFQIHLLTRLASSVKLHLLYSHTDKDDRITWQMHWVNTRNNK